jgi:hypothetical protein
MSKNQTGFGSTEVYDGGESRGQLSNAEPRLSEEDMQRAANGPRGVPGQPDPSKMTPQRDKKTPHDDDPGHTA